MKAAYLTHKTYFYHLEETPLFPNSSVSVRLLKEKKIALINYTLDEENIKVYGAQLVNYVYFLNKLGIADLRKAYTRAFKKTFPDNQDAQLSDLDYSAKLYGMTHFILAASNYYQTELNTHSFHWIIRYFEMHINEIIKRSESDLVAEVGICLMLVKSSNLTVINKIKAYLNTMYNKTYHMIPYKQNSFDLSRGEHRNILTIMFLNWPNKLSTIPYSFFQRVMAKNFVLTEDGSKLTYGIRIPYSDHVFRV